MPLSIPELLEPCGEYEVTPEMIDYNGHLNVAHYGFIFDIAGEPPLRRLDLSKAYRERENHCVFVVESHGRFLKEAHLGDKLRCFCKIVDFTDKAIIMLMLLLDRHEQVIASQEITYLHIDLARKQAVSMSLDRQSALGEMKSRHAGLDTAAYVGRQISLKKRTVAVDAKE